MAQPSPTVEDLLQQVDALQTQAAIDQELIAKAQRRRLADQAKITNLEIALDSARQIGAAIGILMATENVSQDVAFRLLQRASNYSRRKHATSLTSSLRRGN